MKSNPDLSNVKEIFTSVMSSPGKVTVVGSLNVDLTARVEEFPAPGATVPASDLTYGPGGKSSNQAVAASKIGADVAMVGAVGHDAYGSFVQRSLGDAGVDTSRVVARDLPTGTALITVNAAGENTIVYSAGANRSVSRADLQEAADVLQSADVVALGFESPASVVAAAIDVARSASDGNTETSAHADQHDAPHQRRNNGRDVRGTRRSPQIILNYSPIIDVDPALLTGVDIVVVNEIELRALGERYEFSQLPTQERGGLANVAGSKVDEHADAKPADVPTVHDPEDGMAKEDSAGENDLFTTARRIVATMGLRGLIVTLGPEGCFVVECEDSLDSGDGNPTSDADRSDCANQTDTVPTTNGVYVQGYPVEAVDSTGCGDCFMGTVAASIASGQSLLDSARLATFVASRAATKQGAQSSYSSADELADQLKLDPLNQ
ncbi:ribokinase [Corynebacterium sp.]|uniref:ribokinase n=1 Tax=Corynebacterium sp. TaxID=1720 RepID=UPI0026DA7C73|nr:ribokinase [Corynebacterium sp.]MDO4915185.1 ribokinase [Corynebacterium sp.]